MSKSNKRKHPIRRVLLSLVTVLVLVVVAYVAYVFIDYHRIEDMQSLDVRQVVPETQTAQAGVTYTAISYNIGFGAYDPDFSFFMDGGTESWAKSPESVNALVTGAGSCAASYSPDLVFFEEVDFNSTRSHHINERALLDTLLPAYDAAFAVNFDSPYLFYPFHQPHGKSLSGIGLYSRFHMTGSLRRSLPITTSVTKIVDLDRCYMVSRVPMADGRELVLYTVHLTAYTSDHTVREAQLDMLVGDMTAEYEAGNAVICGGDFNMEMLSTVLDEHTPDWARPMDRAELGVFVNAWDVISDEDRAAQAGSCRDTADVYKPGETELFTLDTFVVSPNVTVESMTCIDTGFAYSDHNPVMMTFHIN